ncbi:DNA mismatch repair protein MSH5 [Marchantia polymorpha subsp. ruderalis]|uniref:DNA mismatch repair proteins mutS family domain-containing protein n=1 Tax=Marchantia polymorpha TaxID=3197 RepID=A0A2R6WVE1_MARPO|nr:hypothetical protein MARPO_0055s0066 [Marchantia polymorpha]BBN02988.1 hypothetical protein Mp_2g19840 [Marchantia polymorpha subsp. ruderalis]|eukprot:PTQ37800.1 hypothetical protein MARPO_0055s0066 [Marchantia polymorpha]
MKTWASFMSKTHTPVELKNIDSLSRNASTIQSRSCSNELEVGTKNANCDMKLERSGDDNSDDVSESDKIYMACIMQGRRVGVAYFNTSSSEMFVMDVCEEDWELPTIQLVKYQIQPTVIFTSTKMDDQFVKCLQEKFHDDIEAPQVKLVKSSMFSYHQAKHRLEYLQVRGVRSDLNQKERVHVLNSMINFGSEMQVRASGGLLAILQQEMLDNHGAIDGEYTQIKSILELSLKGFLHVDAITHDALQIFQIDKHASLMGIGKTKEGFSVFGMLNKCVTVMGRRLLRLWFLRPILDMNVINDRLDTIQILKAATDMTEALQDSLRHVKDIPRLIKKIFSSNSLQTTSGWYALVESVGALWQIRGIFEVETSQRHDHQIEFTQLHIVGKVFSAIGDDLAHVGHLITGVLDFDQSCGENLETIVAYGLCEELDKLKTLYKGLPDFLNKVTDLEMKNISEDISEYQVSTVYVPQVGYFLRLMGNLEESVAERFPYLELAFVAETAEGKECFYRTHRTLELDKVLGDLYHKILDMERAILRNLAANIEEYTQTLESAAKVAAEIDCVTALAIAARDYGYVRPDLREDDVLIIENGRHVLQEMTANRYVPNDTHITKEGRINIVTGPNYSGKSIYAKQVALITFLAHIGSFVPADKAIIGIQDRIFTRVASKETVGISQSSFMIDLNQISVMLRHSTSRSLCLIDEFGKGTLTSDGIGLLCATLLEFASRKSPPKVLACTHFSEIFDENNLPKVGSWIQSAKLRNSLCTAGWSF